MGALRPKNQLKLRTAGTSNRGARDLFGYCVPQSSGEQLLPHNGIAAGTIFVPSLDRSLQRRANLRAMLLTDTLHQVYLQSSYSPFCRLLTWTSGRALPTMAGQTLGCVDIREFS